MTGISSLISDKYVVPILNYHRIGKPERVDTIPIEFEFKGKTQVFYYLTASSYLTQWDFEKQMKFLRKHSYDVVSLHELLKLINNNENLKKKVVITFDDGYEDNYTKAFPIMKKYDIPASIFMVASLVGRKDFLSWDQLREMSENNIDIGGHTMTHAKLSEIKDEQRLRYELYDSKKVLEKGLKKNVDFFAYPFNSEFDDKIIKIIKDSGYKAACDGNIGNKYPDSIYTLRRTGVGIVSKNLFRIKVSGYWPWIERMKIVRFTTSLVNKLL
ncbi:MAG: hypothetical protein BWK75_02830 [Candidatus Altiarchaeales archaeon A3]|nr:MAG: hypothetical protein BWK75_02830 [Candidatus Altiarchaeales archaeon A3]